MPRTAFVEQSGRITPTHVAKWITNGVIADGGAISSVNAILVTGLIVSEPTKIIAETSIFDLSITNIQTFGYYDIGDGGEAFYERTGSLLPGGFQAADGSFWALLPNENSEVNVKQFGAKGDDATDDTLSLQTAITTAINNGWNLFLPTGIYQITDTLTISPTELVGGELLRIGWEMKGAGMRRYSGNFGALIKAVWSGNKNSILEINGNVWRDCLWRDFGLITANNGLATATYGIYFPDSKYSNHEFDRITVAGRDEVDPMIAVVINPGIFGNGEFISFGKCFFYNVTGIFLNNNAGQAFQHKFVHCQGALNPGGTYFNLALSSGGGGLSVQDCDFSSITPASKISNTTIVQALGNNSNINIRGGRWEHITQLYYNPGGSPELAYPVVFEEMELTMDFDQTNAFLNIPGTGSGLTNTTRGSACVYTDTCSDIVTIKNCKFENFAGGTDASQQVAKFIAQNSGGFGHQIYKNCTFTGYTQAPTVVTTGVGVSTILFENCSYDFATALGNFNVGHRPTRFDQVIENNVCYAGRRRTATDNALIQSGRPQNFLLKPWITRTNGFGVAPETPWTISSGTLDYTFGPMGNPGTTALNSYPTAVLIQLAAGKSLSQTITALDLSQSTYATAYYGLNINQFTYVALLEGIPNVAIAAFLIQVLDSVSGQEYGRYEAKRGSYVYPRMYIAIQTKIEQKSSPSFPIVKISNNDSTDLILSFAWQGFFADAFGSFSMPSPSAQFGSSHDSQDWDGVVGNLGVWNRLALPYKSDNLGSNPTQPGGAVPGVPLPDLVSDLYISSDTGLINIYRDGAWEKFAPFTQVSSVPTSGQWPQGSVVYNQAMAAASSPGWGQITAGQRRCTSQWNASTAYTGGQVVYNGTNVYIMTAASGTSAAATGPTGTGSSIADGTCVWDYVSTLAPTACATAWANGIGYNVGNIVTNDTAPVKVYQCTQAGTSAGAGGPTGGTAGGLSAYNIADNTVIWKFIGTLAVFKAMANLAA